MKDKSFSITDKETIAEYKAEVWRLKKELEIRDAAARQALQEMDTWKQTALAQGEGLAQYIIAKDRYREALQKIDDCDECDPEISISLLQLIAREALADRP